MQSSSERIEHDRAYNAFLDCANEFIKNFRDEEAREDPISKLAQFIVHKLIGNAYKPLSDASHPFHRYGVQGEPSVYANFTRLAQDIMLEVQDNQMKPFVMSFFHSNGVYREDMEDLVIDQYYNFVLRAHGIQPSDDDDDDDDDDDNSEDIQIMN